MYTQDSTSIQSVKTSYAFGKTDLITIKGTDYVQHSADEHMLILSRCDNPILKETFDQSQIAALFQSGDLTWHRKHFSSPRMALSRRHADIGLVGSLPEEELTELALYEKLIQGVESKRHTDGVSLSEQSIGPVARQLWAGIVADFMTGGKPGPSARKSVPVPGLPSPRTLLRWHRAYYASGGSILSLRDGRKGRISNRTSRTSDPVVGAMMADYVRGYMDERRPTMKGQYKKFLAAITDRNLAVEREGLPALVPPSLSTFERAVRKLDQFQVHAAREGSRAAMARFRLVGKARTATRPGERVMIDTWTTTLQSLPISAEAWSLLPRGQRDELKRVRIKLCVAMCEASRLILAAHVSLTPSASDTLKTLSMVCSDKSALAKEAGCTSSWNQALTPEAVAPDGGPENIAGRARAGVEDLGAEFEVGPGGYPEVRATLERFFRSVDTGLMQAFTGRTFEGISAKGDYDAEGRASLTVTELHHALVRWIVDIYHNQPHAGLGGKCPNDAWIELVGRYGVLPPPDRERFRAVFGNHFTRRISNRGVRILGLHYASPEVAQLRRRVGQRTVLARVNSDDLGSISVREDVPNAPWLTVPCSISGFDGVGIETWLTAARDLKRKNADLSKLREPIVQKALLDLAALGNVTAERGGFRSTTTTPEQLEMLERELFAAFKIAPSARRGALDEDEEVGFTDNMDAAVANVPPDENGASTGDVPQPDADKVPVVAVRSRGIGSKFLID